MKTQPSNLPSQADDYAFGKLSGLPYLFRGNAIYCWYPGAKAWHKSLHDSMATFAIEKCDYYDIAEKYPQAMRSNLPS